MKDFVLYDFTYRTLAKGKPLCRKAEQGLLLWGAGEAVSAEGQHQGVWGVMSLFHMPPRLVVTEATYVLELPALCILQSQFYCVLFEKRGLPHSPDGKAPACNAGDLGSISALGRSPGEGNDDPLQYPCLENSMDRGAWRATVHGVANSWTWLSD